MTLDMAIDARKSIRKYEDRPIEQEKLMAVLEAGRLAPSARNDQTWKFVVVQDPQKREALVDMCNGQKMVGEAPVTLAICAKKGRNMACGQPAGTIDASIALSFMMLEAAAQGLGTCWLGNFDQDKAVALLNVPEGYEVVAVTPLGYGAEPGRDRSRKSMEEVVVWEKF